MRKEVKFALGFAIGFAGMASIAFRKSVEPIVDPDEPHSDYDPRWEGLASGKHLRTFEAQ